MKKANVIWTPRSQADLREIQTYIARDAPDRAIAFVERVRDRVGRLRSTPQIGAVVPELGDPNIREVLLGNYRIVYREFDELLYVLTVFHSARLLRPDELTG